MVRKFDLNCDIGEGEPLTLTVELMQWVSSVNIACGGHAGTIHSMRLCVGIAKRKGIRIGSHPGLRTADGFGREAASIAPDDLELLLLQQVSALETIVREERTTLHHVKLHGALYHLVEGDEELAERCADTVRRGWKGLKIYCRAGGILSQIARRKRVSVWEEAFCDRAYRPDGSLVPRSEPGALLSDDQEISKRVKELIRSGTICSLSGESIPVAPRTLCIHADTPRAESLVRTVSNILRAAGAKMSPRDQ